MKKPVNILVALTCVFAAFLGGFYIGRKTNRAPVHIYQLTPTREEPVSPEVNAEEDVDEEVIAEQEVPAEVSRLNINTADAAALVELPGIGPALAQRIVDYRTAHGDFAAVEELTRVSGIGDAKLMDILDLITVEAGGSK
ncbi:MAG: ComEA family DNA-binding protein [Oscillospiraceae bacterium]|nr:ComEA family DNA-binding protein [Oscillospiraceae bacterium]